MSTATEPRTIIWVGDALDRVRDFPAEARKAVGAALYDAQLGTTAPSAKPMKGIASGVFEIATRYDTNAYRTVYAVQIGSSLYVLHAFQKKSSQGIKTNKQDLELIKQRYRKALAIEQEHHYES